MRFVEREALDQGEILIHINRTANVSKDLRKVAECIASLGDKVWSVWIEKRRAIKEVVR